MSEVKIHSVLSADYSKEYKDFVFEYITMKRHKDKDVETFDEDFHAALCAEHERAFKHGFLTAIKILGGNFEAFLTNM
ncbi:MAG: hypothetical protein J1G06_04430 [Oscillospiraceae bacterium]|nr:hypothetical protein [Oscillospiraceae bacterium]